MMPALPRDSEWLLRGLASGVGSGPLVLARRQPVSPRHALQGLSVLGRCLQYTVHSRSSSRCVLKLSVLLLCQLLYCWA